MTIHVALYSMCIVQYRIGKDSLPCMNLHAFALVRWKTQHNIQGRHRPDLCHSTKVCFRRPPPRLSSPFTPASLLHLHLPLH